VHLPQKAWPVALANCRDGGGGGGGGDVKRNSDYQPINNNIIKCFKDR